MDIYFDHRAPSIVVEIPEYILLFVSVFDFTFAAEYGNANMLECIRITLTIRLICFFQNQVFFDRIRLMVAQA
jgi:hypothetical protein